MLRFRIRCIPNSMLGNDPKRHLYLVERIVIDSITISSKVLHICYSLDQFTSSSLKKPTTNNEIQKHSVPNIEYPIPIFHLN